MALEKAARPGLGRVIPLPAKIAAECGLAFCANISDEKEIVELMKSSGIKHSDIRIIELYENLP